MNLISIYLDIGVILSFPINSLFISSKWSFRILITSFSIIIASLCNKRTFLKIFSIFFTIFKIRIYFPQLLFKLFKFINLYFLLILLIFNYLCSILNFVIKIRVAGIHPTPSFRAWIICIWCIFIIIIIIHSKIRVFLS